MNKHAGCDERVRHDQNTGKDERARKDQHVRNYPHAGSDQHLRHGQHAKVDQLAGNYRCTGFDQHARSDQHAGNVRCGSSEHTSFHNELCAVEDIHNPSERVCEKSTHLVSLGQSKTEQNPRDKQNMAIAGPDGDENNSIQAKQLCLRPTDLNLNLCQDFITIPGHKDRRHQSPENSFHPRLQSFSSSKSLKGCAVDESGDPEGSNVINFPRDEVVCIWVFNCACDFVMLPAMKQKRYPSVTPEVRGG